MIHPGFLITGDALQELLQRVENGSAAEVPRSRFTDESGGRVRFFKLPDGKIVRERYHDGSSEWRELTPEGVEAISWLSTL